MTVGFVSYLQMNRNSGKYAIATDGQFRNVNATAGQFRKCKCIVKLKKACIFIDFHLDVELQQDVYQISVGIIEHIKQNGKGYYLTWPTLDGKE